MRQLIGGNRPSASSLGSVAVFGGLGLFSASTTEATGTGPWSASGTFSNLLVTFSSAPGAGTSYTFTLRINGVDTALTCTISDTGLVGSDTSHLVAISAGDTLSVHVTVSGSPVAPGTFAFNVEFVTTGNLSCYHTANCLNGTAGSTTYSSVFVSGDTNATAALVTSVVPCAGTFSRWDLKLTVAPGVGKSWTCTIFKNGTKQDGTAGTPNTTITISGNATTTGSATGFSLSVVQGDTLYIEWVPSGTPNLPRFGHSIAFTASSAVAVLAGYSLDTPSTSATEWTGVLGPGSSSSWINNEGNAGPANAWISKGRITNLTCVLDGSPGAAKSYTLSLRKNLANPSGAPSVQMTNTTTGQDNSNKLQLTTNTDTWGMQSVPSGTPTARHAIWSMTVEDIGGGGAGKGNSSGNKRGGGGATSVLYPNGAYQFSIGNAGLDIGST